MGKGYKVFGTTRDKSKKNLSKLNRLGIFNKVNIHKGEATNNAFCKKVINKQINEIYYLAGDSSMVRSFDHPQQSLQSNTIGILNILEIIKKINLRLKFLTRVQDSFMVIIKKINIT